MFVDPSERWTPVPATASIIWFFAKSATGWSIAW
jgi:hypothetical protein